MITKILNEQFLNQWYLHFTIDPDSFAWAWLFLKVTRIAPSYKLTREHCARQVTGVVRGRQNLDIPSWQERIQV